MSFRADNCKFLYRQFLCRFCLYKHLQWSRPVNSNGFIQSEYRLGYTSIQEFLADHHFFPPLSCICSHWQHLWLNSWAFINPSWLQHSAEGQMMVCCPCYMLMMCWNFEEFYYPVYSSVFFFFFWMEYSVFLSCMRIIIIVKKWCFGL